MTIIPIRPAVGHRIAGLRWGEMLWRRGTTPSAPFIMALDRSLLSVVVPVYNEESNLPRLASRLLEVFKQARFDACEAVLVSDGSTDGSERIIAQLVEAYPGFRGVFLTRNFGHQAAVSIGLEQASGSVVCMLDADLQDPPEVMIDFIDALEQGADVAYGIRRKRKESLLKRCAYRLYYRLLRAVASIQIPLDSGDFCAMRRCVVDDMLKLPERNRFIRGIRAWVGYRQTSVVYERQSRYAGRSKYSLAKLIGLAYDGVFSFSNLPIKLMQLAGFVIALLSFLATIGHVAWHLLAPDRFPVGWASLIFSVWFFGGVQLLVMGVVGEYVFRTFDESRQRPTGLIRTAIEHRNSQSQSDTMTLRRAA